MHIINKITDKVFVLMIEGDVVRYNLISETLRGIEYEIVYGFHMRKLFPDITSIGEIPDQFFHENQINKQAVLHWSLGGLGCALGHRLIIKKIVEEKLSKALILEDDVILNTKVMSQLKRYWEYLPSDWELIYLGFILPSKIMNYKFPLCVKVLYAKIRNMSFLNFDASNQNFFNQSYNKFFQKAGVFVGGHAYMLSSTGAIKCLNLNTPLQFYSDPLLMHMVYNDLIRSYNLKYTLFDQLKTIDSYTE
jgi:hypothetical protein